MKTVSAAFTIETIGLSRGQKIPVTYRVAYSVKNNRWYIFQDDNLVADYPETRGVQVMSQTRAKQILKLYL